MKPLTLRRTGRNCRTMGLFGIVPNHLQGLSLQQIAQLPIVVDDRSSPLGDWFEIEDGQRDELFLVGNLTNCEQVAGGMESGRLRVASNVGDFLAPKMCGGQVEIEGSAGRYAGGELAGGLVIVHGNCDQYAAAAPPGRKRGMNGGLLVIHGHCDQWLATRMRRGTVIVHGNVAAGCASRMIAGNVVLCGQYIEPLASHMARGTLLILHPGPLGRAPAGFTAPESVELSYLKILVNSFSEQLPQHLQSPHLPPNVWRSLGDRVQRGLGEIIWLNAQESPQESLVAHA